MRVFALFFVFSSREVTVGVFNLPPPLINFLATPVRELKSARDSYHSCIFFRAAGKQKLTRGGGLKKVEGLN